MTVLHFCDKIKCDTKTHLYAFNTSRRIINMEKKLYKLTKKQIRYSKIKDIIDRTAGVVGTVLLSPVFLGIVIAIKKEEGIKAPVFFKQKRVGKDQKLFNLYKFRTMKLSTPKDTPTHLLSNPEQYITSTGKFLRRSSLDELPQFLNIIKGDMAISGPRPALWNQDDLIAEREAYGVHQIKPGLTGWAQIHGRDELEIPVKAKLDAYYLQHFGIWIDIKCFFGTIFSVLKSDGVVEGGTGELNKKINTNQNVECNKTFYDISKNVLITGANSYIGMNIEENLKISTNCDVRTVNMVGVDPADIDFSSVDTVFHVAGIAHRKETKENAHEYYEVNRNLAIKTAKAAKNNGVKHFIILSTMGVYGMTMGKINENTPLNPVNHYQKAKAQADEKLLALASDDFKVCIVRPPMVYGKGCKGNYQSLRKFALKFPFFPQYNNSRSMIHIDNLASIIVAIIVNEVSGVVLPQDREFVNTSDMVRNIRIINKKKIVTTKLFNPVIRIFMPKITPLQKVFGSLIYEQNTNVPEEWLVHKSLEETIRATEE